MGPLLTRWALIPYIYGINIENDHMVKIVKIKAFPVVFRPNKGAHRVLRSILHKNRPDGRFRRRFDFVETPPRILGIFWKFSWKLAISQNTKSAQRVKQAPWKNIFYRNELKWPLYPTRSISDPKLDIINKIWDIFISQGTLVNTLSAHPVFIRNKSRKWP